MKSLNRLIFLPIFISFSTASISQSLADVSFGTDSTFEVVTWNLEWFPKNGVNTIDSVQVVIEALNVDVIACQEITDTTLLKQMVDSLDDYEVYFESAWFAGLAYIYRTDSIQISNIYEIYETSPYWNAFPRSPMVMELIYDDEPLIIINNHYKCCGDGVLDLGNTSDEEDRRFTANQLIKDYIDANFANSKVMVVGDLNDILTDVVADNIFTPFTDFPTDFSFADDAIANGPSSEWSFPGWPSHLDHILITNEMFDEFNATTSDIQTISIDDFLVGGISEYDANISDHLPVGLKIEVEKTFVSLIENSEIQEEMNFYPNPCTSIAFIAFEDVEIEAEIKIYNSLGQIMLNALKSSNEENISLDVSELPIGIYYLMFTSSNGKTERIKFSKT